MRKAQKRLLGQQRQADNLATSIARGLEAQTNAQEQRAREQQEALIRRDNRTKNEIPDGPKSKIAKEKQDRVNARLAAKEYTETDLERMHQEELLDMGRRDEIYKEQVVVE